MNLLPNSDLRLVDSASRYSLPFPISSLYVKSRTAHDPSARYGYSFRLVEGVVRFLAFVSLSDAASRGATDDEVRRWLRMVEFAGLGKLAALAKGTAEWLNKNGGPFVAEMAELWGGNWEGALEHVINLRNRHAHDDVAVSSAEAAPLLDALQPFLAEVLSGVQFLRHYHLGAFRSLRRTGAGFGSYWYPCRGLEEAGQYVSVAMESAPHDDFLAVFDAGFNRGLYLTPFLLWASSSTDKAERVFWLQRTENGRPRYSHPVLRHEPAHTAPSVELTALPARSEWPGRCEVQLDEASKRRLLSQEPLLPSNSRFTLVGKIGEGAMGTVYEAHDTILDQRRALKFIRPELMRSPDALRRLQREARLLASLDSPAVVRIFDLDMTGEVAFLVMELVPGEDLGSFIERTGPVDASKAVEILEGLCEAISAVHALGVVHRDVKPSNVMLRGGQVRLLDFGIALPHQGTRYSASIDRMGTPVFMAPEQWEGDSSGATDVFAAGRVLAAMLLGRSPPMGEQLAVALAGAPSGLRAVVLKATAPNPTSRYSSAEELANAARSSFGASGIHSSEEDRRSIRHEQASPPPQKPAARPAPPLTVAPPRPPARSLVGPGATISPQTRPGTGASRVSWANRGLTLRARDGAERHDMEAFAQLWGPTRSLAESLGWRSSPGSIVELYFQFNARSIASEVFISPYKPDRFLFRATPRPGTEQALLETLVHASSRLAGTPRVGRNVVKRANGSITVVEVVSTWADVVGAGSPSDEEVAARLKAFVEPLIRAIPQM